jgi:hypothetical protein
MQAIGQQRGGKRIAFIPAQRSTIERKSNQPPPIDAPASFSAKSAGHGGASPGFQLA